MIRLTTNGETLNVDVDPNTPLLWAIRERQCSGQEGGRHGCFSADASTGGSPGNGKAVRNAG
jgi:isoquinoline 1-oxidoreductase alpha subunit